MLDSIESPLAIFDRDAVLDLVDGEMELLQDLAGMLLEDLPGNVEQIENAIAAGDVSTVHHVTHQLKSSVGNLGGRAAQNAVQQLEQNARDGHIDGSQELFANCRYELDRFCTELNAFLAG